MDSLKVEKIMDIFHHVHWNKQVHLFWSKSILIPVRDRGLFLQTEHNTANENTHVVKFMDKKANGIKRLYLFYWKV